MNLHPEAGGEVQRKILGLSDAQIADVIVAGTKAFRNLGGGERGKRARDAAEYLEAYDARLANSLAKAIFGPHEPEA